MTERDVRHVVGRHYSKDDTDVARYNRIMPGRSEEQDAVLAKVAKALEADIADLLCHQAHVTLELNTCLHANLVPPEMEPSHRIDIPGTCPRCAGGPP